MTKPAAGRSFLLPAAVLAFALVSVLWFGLGFAITAQLIADGSMRDRTHMVFGYADAAVEAAVVAGWFWALFASARAGSPVNGPVKVMCGATAAAQVAAVISMTALMSGWSWDEPVSFLLGYAVVAVLFAILIDRSRKQRAIDSSG